MRTSTIDKKLLEVHFHLSRFIKSKIESSSKMINLTLMQVRTLFFLREKPNSTVSDVAAFFHTTIPTATVLLDKLAEMKLVTRTNDQIDRRVVRIHLTPNGQGLLNKAAKERMTIFNKIISKLTLKDKKNLLRIMENIISNPN